MRSIPFCLILCLKMIIPYFLAGSNLPVLAADPARINGLKFDELKHLVQGAKSVTVFVFQPGQTGLKPLDSLTIQDNRELSRKEWKRIRKTLLMEKGYDFTLYKNCLFQPVVGFRLSNKDSATDILCDLNCDTWYLHDKNGARQFEADGLHDALLAQIHTLFPATTARLKFTHP